MPSWVTLGATRRYMGVLYALCDTLSPVEESSLGFPAPAGSVQFRDAV